VVGDDPADDLVRAVAPAELAGGGPTAIMTFQGHECFPQCPAAGAGPGGLVGGQAAPEGGGGPGGKERPGHDQVAGRIADRGAPEVDHRVQGPVGQ
jgi:hypothetical protein